MARKPGRKKDVKILKSTEIGCREGAAQRELEWEQRRDQEGENQLDDHGAYIRED